MTTIASSTGSSGGTLSSAGIGSGLDVNAIVTSLMNVNKLPLNNLQSAATEMQTKLSAFGQMQSLVSSFHDAALPLSSASTYAVTSTSSSDPTSVTAASTSGATPGSYSVSVTKLAATQSTVSASGVGEFAAATDVVGAGTLTIDLGAWNAGQTAFTPKTGATSVVLTVSATATLQDISNQINAANAGVSATVVTDATGSRLALQSTATGATNGFRVQVADATPTNTATQGLSRLAFDPQTPNPNGGVAMSSTQSASDSAATINGIAITTSSNTLTNVVGGMTFTLGKLTTSPVTVTVSSNTAAIQTSLTSFVSAYNALAAFLSQATAYDPVAHKGALLQGDATATGLQNQLRSVIGQLGSNSPSFRALSDIGLEFQKDGTLKLNQVKVTAAMSNLPELTKAMTTLDLTTPSNNGFAKKITDWSNTLLAFNGTLPGKTSSIQSQIAANQKDQTALNARLAAVEAGIRAQYTALDKTMSGANALSAYVSQQITTWNKNTA